MPQRLAFRPIELGSASSMSSAPRNVQVPIDVKLLPPPERLLREKKKGRKLQNKAISPKALQEDTTNVNHDDEYERVFSSLLSVDG